MSWILRFPDFHSINCQCEADVALYFFFLFLDIQMVTSAVFFTGSFGIHNTFVGTDRVLCGMELQRFSL